MRGRIGVGVYAIFLAAAASAGCDGTARSGQGGTPDAGAGKCQPACPAGATCGPEGLCLGEVVWSYPFYYAETALDLTLAGDGTVVVPSRDPDLITADLQGLSLDGRLLWTANVSTVEPGDSVVQLSSPVAAPTGAIYRGQMDVLTALSATGQSPRFRPPSTG